MADEIEVFVRDEKRFALQLKPIARTQGPAPEISISKETGQIARTGRWVLSRHFVHWLLVKPVGTSVEVRLCYKDLEQTKAEVLLGTTNDANEATAWVHEANALYLAQA